MVLSSSTFGLILEYQRVLIILPVSRFLIKLGALNAKTSTSFRKVFKNIPYIIL
jgi:hypothetical protein